MTEKDKLDLQSLYDDIGEISGKHFVRFTSTSGKNEKMLTSLSNRDEIIRFITTNQLFLHREMEREKDTYLIIMPWNPDIEDKFEFRLFVRNNKITGLSQQFYFKNFNYSYEELDFIEKAVLKAPFLKVAPYNDYIADVYVKNGKCYLIEYNPFGAGSGAGSALFNWKTDYDVLYGSITPAEFKFLSMIQI